MRLERGNVRGVSEDVLDSIARALQLDEAERMHLFNLCYSAEPGSPSRRALDLLASWASTPQDEPADQTRT